MKLHLPVRLFKSVLVCLAAVASFSLGSGVAWAEAQNLTFSGSSLTWDTSAENKSFVDEEDAAASFAAGDNVSFTGESAVTLGENITVGTLDIAAGADVTIDLEEYTLHTDTISLSGTLDVGDSLGIASGSILAVKNAAAVLDSALVLGEKSGLVVESAASLNSHTLTLQGSSNLILTAAGDGKTYTLFSGISSLLDKNGDTLAAGSYSVNDYFDKTAPGSGFWADASLVYTADGSLQIVRHGEEVQEALTITTRQTGSKTYNYYEGVCFRDITASGSDVAYGGAIGWGTITLSNNGSVVFEGNTGEFGGAIYGGTITLSNNGSVTFSGNTASSSSYIFAEGGAIDGDNTITLSNNGSVAFSGNTASGSSSAEGGAIYGDYGGTITLSNNGSVTFSGNTASGSAEARGGAICGHGTITLSNNGSVTFSGNTASGSSSSSSYSGAYAFGGAIYGGPITLSHNGSVTFSGNTASGSPYFYGGAICGGTITLSHNGSVSFSRNTASGLSSSSSYSDAYSYAFGGAIYEGSNSSITLSHNGSVTFSGNTASGTDARGGAIYGGSNISITLSNNGSVTFSGNMASGSRYSYGGAICKQYGIFSIQNNASVVFEKNYALEKETLRLQSLYAYDLYDAGEEMLVNFSAPKGGKIEFRDSIYIDVGSNSASAFHLNNWYVNDAGEKVAQTGDIIFTGEDATAENLKAILAEHGIHREATSGEIRRSKTSEVWGTMQLHDGRLIVRDGAIIEAEGITVHGSASGESTPTLWLDNGDFSTRKNAVTISGGSALRLSGKNTLRNSTLTLSAGSTLIIDVAAAHTTTAALTLNSSTLSLGGTITLQLNAAEGLNIAGRYMLLSGVSAPTDWASNIAVSGGVWTIDDLSWVNNILYLNFPTLTEATWNNQSGDRLWNVNSSVNWEQHDIDYAYKDGIGVIFGDEGAGKVTLVGTLTPASVLVNSTGNYSFEGSGSLSGGMTLTKQGSGTLSISTANSYTGGTVIDGGSLTITHANALGTGGIVTKGNSSLVVNGVTLKLQGTIDNTAGGELSLKGSFDASGLTLNRTEEGRLALSGTKVSQAESGFARGVEYSVQIVEGGTTVNDGASISHKDYLSRTQLVLGEDGYARAGGAVDYTHFFLTGGDSAVVGEIADVATQHQETLTGVTMDSGELEVDRSIEVNATGGSISITDDAVLSGTVEDTAVSTAAGDYNSEISAILKGDTTLEVNGGSITVSGDNSYSGGTVVNGGILLAGHNKAFGAGDVTVNSASLDLSRCTIANKVRLNGNSTLGHADGASHIVLGGGSKVNFRDGFTLSSGKVLDVAAGGATYTGALTLGGGTIELDGKLTVQGDVVFESGKQTTIDISDWSGAGDGEVLVDFGSNSCGYTNDSLALSGIAGDWELKFDSATGNLVLAAVRDDFSPNLDRNQQAVYDTVKDIMTDVNPDGVLGLLGKEIVNSRDEAALKRALDEISGREYATIMSSQMEGNMGHLRRLRAAAGAGTPLGEYVSVSYCYPSNKGASVQIAPSPVIDSRRLRAGISVFHEQGELDSDNNGDGYDRSETGAQLTMEYMVSNEFIMGMGISQSRTRLTPDYGKRRHEDNTHFDLYGVYQSGRWSTTTALGVGLHQHDLGRTVAGMQTEAEADGFSVNFLQEVAYTVWADEQQGVQVYGAVESSFNQVDSFTETGAGNASLTMDSQEAWATDVTLGLRYNHALPALDKALPGTLSLHAGVVASLGDVEETSTMRFSGAPGYSFRQGAAERNRWGYSVGVSVNLPVSANVAAFGSAEAVLRGDSYTADAQLGLKVAF